MSSGASRTSQPTSGHHHKQVCGTTKARVVPIILINTTKQNILLQQHLLATELFTAEYHQIEHRANMERKGDSIDIPFLPVAPNTIRAQLEQVEVTSYDIYPSSSNKPFFGPRPNVQATDFYSLAIARGSA